MFDDEPDKSLWTEEMIEIDEMVGRLYARALEKKARRDAEHSEPPRPKLMLVKGGRDG